MATTVKKNLNTKKKAVKKTDSLKKKKIIKHSQMRINSAKAVVFHEANALYALGDHFDTPEFSKAFINTLHLMDKVKKANGKFIVVAVGKPGYIGKKIAALFASMGTPAFFIHAAEAGHGDMGMITKNDAVMVISNSGESKEIFPTIDYCKKFKVPMIALTRNAKGRLAKNSDIPLVMPNIVECGPLGKAPTTSMIMTMAMGDALSVVMAERSGFNEKQYKEWHQSGALGASMVYVKDLYNKDIKFLSIKETDNLKDVIKKVAKFNKTKLIAVTNKKGELTGEIKSSYMMAQIDHILDGEVIAKDLATEPVIIEPTAKLMQASHILNEIPEKECFVVKGKKAIGILTNHDLIVK